MTLSRKIVISIIIALGLILIAIFNQGLYKNEPLKKLEPPNTEASTQTDQPKIVSVKPDFKQNPIILPDQNIEIEFNLPLENIGEFKHRIDVFKDYETKISLDRKTVTIIPKKPFDLGKSFTLFILGDTKFDGHKTLGIEQHFSFRTIAYHGV